MADVPNPYASTPGRYPPGTPSGTPPGAPLSEQPGRLAYVEARFGPVARFEDRVLALLVDGLVSLVAGLPAFVGFLLVLVGVGRKLAVDEQGAVVAASGGTALIVTGVVLVVLGYALSIAVNLWNRVFRMGRTGRSIGKERTGLLLVDNRTGRPIGAATCLGRELLGGIINQAFGLSYLWALWDEDRQTLADKLVHSTVIRVPPA